MREKLINEERSMRGLGRTTIIGNMGTIIGAHIKNLVKETEERSMPRWDDPIQKQLGIFYLFLSAETKISDADYLLFESYGKSIEGFFKKDIAKYSHDGAIIGTGPASISIMTLIELASNGSIIGTGPASISIMSEGKQPSEVAIIGTGPASISIMRNLVAGVKEKEGFSEIKEKITGECEKLLAASGDKTRFEIVSDLFSKETSDDPAVNRSILWLLILHNHRNIGKKQLVDLWAKESKIAEDILLEMRDTCETDDAINEYKKWLNTSKGMSCQEVNSIMQELDKDGISLLQSVNDLVVLG